MSRAAYLDRAKLFALSFSQPWATAILQGPKRAENRSWRLSGVSPDEPLWAALHAAKSWDAPDAWAWPDGSLARRDHIQSAITGLIRIVDVIPVQTARQHREPGVRQWASGPWVWVIDRAVPLEQPIRCGGALGLWPVPPDHVAEIDRQTRSVRIGPRACSVCGGLRPPVGDCACCATLARHPGAAS